jgi:hypothetical protein
MSSNGWVLARVSAFLIWAAATVYSPRSSSIAAAMSLRLTRAPSKSLQPEPVVSMPGSSTPNSSLSMGGSGNVKTVVTAIYSALDKRGLDGARFNPWHFPSESEFCSSLQDRGFEVRELVLFDRPTALPGGFEDWMDTFCGVFTEPLSPNQRPGFVREVVDVLRPSLYTVRDGWVLDYVRLRFKAARPKTSPRPTT